MQAFTSRFVPSMQLYRPCHKTAHRALQERFRLFTLFCRRCVAGASAYTAPAAPRWSVLQRRSASGTYQIPPSRPDAAQVSTDYYYKRYIRVRPLLWIHARQCSISQSMQARRGLLPLCADRWQVLRPAHQLRCQRLHLYRVSPAAVSILPTPGGLQSGTGHLSGHTCPAWHPQPGWAVQQQGRDGRRGTIGGSRRSSFRAFAR